MHIKLYTRNYTVKIVKILKLPMYIQNRSIVSI